MATSPPTTSAPASASITSRRRSNAPASARPTSVLPEPRLWVLYVAAALIAACTAIRRPPLDALMPRLVEREELTSASALQWAVHNVAHMAGPAIGGVLIATAGAAVTYASRRSPSRGPPGALT
ncbi:MAG TPA: MFS transporter, partial [Solirubrobacteraceae bacterium]|nr:MFS transporter [Solirubrobacteraceae bacterium]